MALLPEIAVQSTFVTAGLHFSYAVYVLLHYRFSLNSNLTYLEDDFGGAPLVGGLLVVSVFTAAGTAALLHILKRRTRCERFRQTQLLLVASVFSVLSGLPSMVMRYTVNQEIAAAYIGAAAHGITYIAGLSFVNMRISQRCRSSRLALCHLWYLFGVGLAMLLLAMGSRDDWIGLYGFVVLLSSSVSIVLLLLNELFQYYGVYDYRCSLDEDLQRVNAENVLLYDRKEIIDTLRANAARFPDTVMVVSQVKRRWKLSGLLVLLRLHGFMQFAPLVTTAVNRQSDEDLLMFGLPIAGAWLAAIVLMFWSAKRVYLLAVVLQTLCALMSIFWWPTMGAAQVPMALFFGFAGVLYAIGDIAVVDTSEFARTEINVCVGFALEKLLLAGALFLQYFLQIGYPLELFQVHLIAYVGLNCGLAGAVLYLYSDTRGKSLYRIRKEIMGIRMVKKPSTPEPTPDVLPPIPYGYNSATGTYDFPRKTQLAISPLAMPTLAPIPATTTTDWNSVPSAPSASPRIPGAGNRMSPSGASAGQTVFFTGGMDNRYDRDFQRMSPGNVMSRTLVGGAIFSSIAWSM